MEMRQFNPSDWDAFGGAESWPDGAEPLFGEVLFANGDEYFLVLDRTGGCLLMAADNGDMSSYSLDMPLLNQDEARVLAQRLGEPRHRIDFLLAGFKRD